MVRNALFRRVELFARRRWHDLGELDADSGWTPNAGRTSSTAYFAEHDDVGIGADARGPALLIIDRQPGVWRVRQILDDPAGDHDWGFDVEVDLEASDEEGAAVSGSSTPDGRTDGLEIFLRGLSAANSSSGEFATRWWRDCRYRSRP